MTQDNVNVLQQVTLQVALLVAVIVLWMELKAARKEQSSMLNQAADTLVKLAASQAELAGQLTEQQRIVINLMKGRDADLILPTKYPPNAQGATPS